MNIGQVAKKTGLTTHTLRYYEQAGIIPPVPRNENGIRYYDESMVEWILFVKCMRDAGISIETLARYYALYKEGSDTESARKQLLIEERQLLIERIAEMNDTLAKLSYKIENYEKLMKSKMSIHSVGKCANN